MFGRLKKIGLAAMVATAFAAVSAGPASAWGGCFNCGFHHHHHFFRHHVFFAPRFAGPDCFVRRVVRFNRFGERVVVIRRVCD